MSMLKDSHHSKQYILNIYDGSVLIIPKQTVKTLFDLKTIVQTYKSIEIENQKFTINGKTIKNQDKIELSSLAISDKDLLKIFTLGKKGLKQEVSSIQQNEIVSKNMQQMVEIQPIQTVQYLDSSIAEEKEQAFAIQDIELYINKIKSEEIQLIEPITKIQKFAFLLWRQGIPKISNVLFNPELQNKLIQQFIQLNIFQQKKSEFLGNTQFLRFVCKKLAQSNPNLKQLPNCITKIEMQLYQFEPSLTKQQKDKLQFKIAQSIDLSLVIELKKLGYDEKVARNIIEISQNNLLKAIEYLTVNKKLFEIQVTIPTQKLDKCKFLYSWFLKPDHTILRLKLASSHLYLDIYTLSMKHKCSQFYHLLLDERKYVQKLIRENKPNLYNTAL